MVPSDRGYIPRGDYEKGKTIISKNDGVPVSGVLSVIIIVKQACDPIRKSELRNVNISDLGTF